MLVPMRRITVNVTEEEHAAFRVACAKVDASMAAVARALIIDWTRRRDGEAQARRDESPAEPGE
jgi:ParG